MDFKEDSNFGRNGEMEFRDLKAQYQALKTEINQGTNDVITSSHFISGAQVAKLEQELAEYVGVKHCVTCANGTDALSLALMAWGIGEGDAVFVPDFTFFLVRRSCVLRESNANLCGRGRGEL